MVSYQQTTFASTDERPTCLFGCCHILRCAACLGILTAVWLLANIVQVIAVYGNPGISAAFLSIVLGLLILYAIFTGCLLYGLKSGRIRFMLPFLQYQGLAIVVCIGMIILCIVSLATLKRTKNDLWFYSVHKFSIVLLVELVVGIIFQAIVFYVVFKCYRFLRDKSYYNEDLMTIGQTNARFTNNNNVVTLSGTTPVSSQTQFHNPIVMDDKGDVVDRNKAMPWGDASRA